MDRNLINTDIARRVLLAMREVGSDVHSVAQAADITSSGLNDRLSGRVEFQPEELVRVGGFLRIPVTRLLEVAA